MKLNLGCGHRILPKEEGWINIDFSSDLADVKADVRKLPFDDSTIEYIAAYHIIEHFTYPTVVNEILPEWSRVLKRFGILDLEFPNVRKLMDLYDIHKESVETLPYHESVINLIIGNHDVVGAGHMWAWTDFSMKCLLERHKFIIKRISNPDIQQQFPGGAEKAFTKIIAIKKGE